MPALALAPASIQLFLEACDRNASSRALLAGFVAGLAMQTKHTGAVASALMLLAAPTFGRWRLWPAAAVAAARVVLTWEFLVALLYGESRFLHSLPGTAGGSWAAKGALAAPFFSFVGGGPAPLLLVLCLAALGAAALASRCRGGGRSRLRPDRPLRGAVRRRGVPVAHPFWIY